MREKRRSFLRAALLTAALVAVLLPFARRASAADTEIDIVTAFPDGVFQEYVRDRFDSDGNGKLSSAEVLAVKTISVTGMNIRSLTGVEHFTNLEQLVCNDNLLRELDVSKNTSLWSVDCSDNELTVLTLGKISTLRTLDCSNNKLTKLDVKPLTSLSTLRCASNQISSIDVSACSYLATLNVADNRLSAIDVSKNDELTYLFCYENNLSELNLSGKSQLISLRCEFNRLTSLNLSDCGRLFNVQCSGNRLTSLDVSMLENLYYLECYSNRLTSLQLGSTNLDTLCCGDNLLTSLTTKGSISLLDCSGNKLKTLDVGDDGVICAGNPLQSVTRTLNLRYATASCVPVGTSLTLQVPDDSYVSYQWQAKSVLSSVWKNCAAPSATTPRLTFKVQAAHDSYDFRCVMTARDGSEVIIQDHELRTIPFVVNQPRSMSATVGETATLKVVAAGTEPMTYQWQIYDTLKHVWSPITAASADYAEYSFLVDDDSPSGYYRCVVKDANGFTVTTEDDFEYDVPYLSIKSSENEPYANTNVTAITVRVGEPVKMSVISVSGVNPPYSYQWYACRPGSGTWVRSTAASGTAKEYSFTAQAGHDGYEFFCQLKGSDGNYAESNIIKLTVLPAITTQPANKTVTVGSTANFTVVAKGAGTLKYQWQAYNPSTKKWVNSSSASAKTATLSITAQSGHNGFWFRCIVTDANGKTMTSDEVMLTVMKAPAKPVIITQPAAKIVPVGGTAEFTVLAAGAGTLKYQWQAYNPTTKKWVNSSSESAKTAKLSITAQAGHHNFKFRCIVTDGNGKSTTSGEARLTVRPGIVTQPKDVTVSVGGTVKLSVTANSVGTLSYQWQVWDTATSSWKNSVAASAKTANFSFTAQKGHNGKKFRCVLTDSNGNQTVTRGALVTVK